MQEFIAHAQMIDGEVYEVDDSLLAWMDAFEGHPEVYERDVIEVRLSPTCSTPVFSASATTPNCRSRDDDSSCGTAGSDSESKRTSSARSEEQAANEVTHCRVETETEACTPNEVAAGGDDVALGNQQQTCSCLIYFFKRYPPELVELETYESYDAFNIPGKPYQPE